jgi:hypothetical protein
MPEVMRHILSHQRGILVIEAMHRGTKMNRRKLLYSLTCLSAASLTAPCLFSLEPNGRASAEWDGSQRASREARRSPYEPLRIGSVGVGVGVYWQYRIAPQLDYPHKMIAIDTNANNDRIRWRHPEGSSLLLIGGHDELPATIPEAHRMGRDRKSDIVKLVSGLDVAFLVTGLNGISGKGLTSVVAETLRESGVFTIAIVPGRREPHAVKSLRQLVDVAFEFPFPWQVAPGVQDSFWREHFTAAIARKCREITPSLV